MNKQIIHTDKAPDPVGPYSQAVSCHSSKMVFLSGQIGLNPITGKLEDKSFDIQVKQAFKNMMSVIEAAGASVENVIKTTLYLTDLSKFEIVNNIMADLFPKPFPARTTIEVSGLPKGAQFEIEVVLSL
ncbi:TdcF protein [Candidatus Kinetoplastibacterium blastocrithidii TCC012E]|uniref:TdcF protein n=1 Tax=Candidatus Kinetoplastidibacterium blastocrithidiae TCC012E TaxID=1208922 RepID=M1M0I5_9PROT|nr:Rid family detoxifying hydrolase [Candidatus Kinetoplastibacterium blastocrithidii]AFZ83659.1 TdcF protein [Candidatus Kinetoplastibacterium blastocrithidii (ex Strigomonas culicis)]AGF49781.1 TdcF protein [Candidatus Kinetoplastibacterium blastocrithidii TCC012E]